MDVKIINPFIESAIVNIEKVAQLKSRKENVSIKKKAGSGSDLLCVIGLSGHMQGSAILSLPKRLALKLASALFMEELTELNHESMDAVGEMANIIIGHARNQLVSESNDLTISTPVFIKGKDVDISAPKGSFFVVADFRTIFGYYSISVNIKNT